MAQLRFEHVWCFCSCLLMVAIGGLGAQAPVCGTYVSKTYQPHSGIVELWPREKVHLSVVVHVLYNEEEENITNEQIFSQLEVLNRAFNGEGLSANGVPAIFQPLLSDVGISFCLANLDPQGNPTTGITRTAVSVPAMGLSDAVFDADLGGVDNWDPKRYINIRVVDMGGSLLGKASMPGEEPPERDGLVIDPRYFGTVGLAANSHPHHLGLTTVHEMGHYFGLLHPWGRTAMPSSCDEDDGLQDTPKTSNTFLGICPDAPVYSCGSADMYTNYMYYTDDPCMGQFTPQQKNVIWHTLLTLRSSLLSGSACASSSPLLLQETAAPALVYPNPFVDVLHLQWSGTFVTPLLLDLYDLQGRKILTHYLPAGTSSYELQASTLPAGCYLLRFSSFESGKRYWQKVVKK